MTHARRFALLSPAVGTANIGDHFIERAVIRLLGATHEYARVSIRRPLGDAEIELVNSTEAAVLCGTNLYQRDWECALTEEALERFQVPVVPVGLGSSSAELSDRAVGATTSRMIRALHERCTVGGVRDPHSLEVVRGVGVTNVVLTGCPVLFWNGLPRPIAPSPRSRVVVTARNWLMHHWPQPVDHPKQIQFLREVLGALSDVPVTFAVHEPYDERLVERLRLRPDQVIAGLGVDRFLSLYADREAVVLALRLHGGMLALANGVPAVLVGHDTRTYSFCQMLGLSWTELLSARGGAEAVARVRNMLGGQIGDIAAVTERSRALMADMRAFLGANGLPSDGLTPSRAGHEKS